MTNLYDQLLNIVGTPPNDLCAYFLYIACVFIVITSMRLLYTFIFKFLLNIRI